MYKPLSDAVSKHNLSPTGCPKEVIAAIVTTASYNEILDVMAVARDFIEAACHVDDALGRAGRAEINMTALNHYLSIISITASTLNHRVKVLCDALGLQEDL